MVRRDITYLAKWALALDLKCRSVLTKAVAELAIVAKTGFIKASFRSQACAKELRTTRASVQFDD